MTYHDMLANVSTATGTDQTRAEKIARAFLETLEARLPKDEAKELVAQLPEELRETLHPAAPVVKRLSKGEFLTQFASTAHLSDEQAPRMARAIWQSLEEAVPDGELDEVREVLPDDLVASFT